MKRLFKNGLFLLGDHGGPYNYYYSVYYDSFYKISKEKYDEMFKHITKYSVLVNAAFISPLVTMTRSFQHKMNSLNPDSRRMASMILSAVFILLNVIVYFRFGKLNSMIISNSETADEDQSFFYRLLEKQDESKVLIDLHLIIIASASAYWIWRYINYGIYDFIFTIPMVSLFLQLIFTNNSPIEHAIVKRKLSKFAPEPSDEEYDEDDED